MRPFAAALAVILAVALSAGSAHSEVPAASAAAGCADDAGWDDPVPPIRLHGNTWYVGTCGISAILVTSPKGHVLLDAGTEKSAQLVEANIRAAGFRPQDIHYILNSHGHHDHAGGIAYLQKISGATVLARRPSAWTLENGRSDATDPQFGTTPPFPAISHVRTIGDRDVVKVGPLRLTAHATPGHTPGSTSWTWRSCDAGDCIDIAYVDSVSAISSPGYRFGDEAAHPGASRAFRDSLASIAGLPCDALITPHPSGSNLWDRVGARATGTFAEPRACRDYAESASKRLDARVAEESKIP